MCPLDLKKVKWEKKKKIYTPFRTPLFSPMQRTNFSILDQSKIGHNSASRSAIEDPKKRKIIKI